MIFRARAVIAALFPIRRGRGECSRIESGVNVHPSEETAGEKRHRDRFKSHPPQLNSLRRTVSTWRYVRPGRHSRVATPIHSFRPRSSGHAGDAGTDQWTEAPSCRLPMPVGSPAGARDAAGGRPVGRVQPSRPGDSERALVKRVREKSVRCSSRYRSAASSGLARYRKAASSWPRPARAIMPRRAESGWACAPRVPGYAWGLNKVSALATLSMASQTTSG